MNKKVLNTQAMMNELRGQSAFFRQDSPIQAETDDLTPKIAKNTFRESKRHSERDIKKEIPSPITHREDSPINLHIEKKNDTLNSNDSSQANMQASVLANTQDDIVETIRKTVKQVGKDTLFVRLTPEEKHQITSGVYALNEMYRGEGRKTSENEIGRIAVNFILEDYRANGEQSILTRVLAALNA